MIRTCTVCQIVFDDCRKRKTPRCEPCQRELGRRLAAERYADPEKRKKQQARCRIRQRELYDNDPTFKKRAQAATKKYVSKIKASPEYIAAKELKKPATRKYMREWWRKRHADPVHRDHDNARRRKRYAERIANDAKYREDRAEYLREYRRKNTETEMKLPEEFAGLKALFKKSQMRILELETHIIAHKDHIKYLENELKMRDQPTLDTSTTE